MYKFSVAPMMDWTDKHCRYFHRLMSKNVQLYTEMVTARAILRGDTARLLDFNALEQPLVLQLGGSNPVEMAQCAVIARDFGYVEVNINVGCPSNRVQSGRFGACLMQTPSIVAECVSEMQAKSGLRVSVKSRIGVDDMEDYAQLATFVDVIRQANCVDFVIHARKAWLKGLSPKQNRSIPPLNYPWVYQIKRDFRALNISINGNIQTLDDAQMHLQHVDGVMLGRVAYHQPYLLSEIDGLTDKTAQMPPSREQVLLEFMAYMETQRALGVSIRRMTRHILGLYHGQPHAKHFKQLLSGAVVGFAQLEEWLEFVRRQ